MYFAYHSTKHLFTTQHFRYLENYFAQNVSRIIRRLTLNISFCFEATFTFYFLSQPLLQQTILAVNCFKVGACLTLLQRNEHLDPLFDVQRKGKGGLVNVEKILQESLSIKNYKTGFFHLKIL